MAASKDVTPFYYTHVGKNVLLLLLSLVTAPISAAVVFISFVYSYFNPKPKIQLPQHGSRKTILVTGVSMTKGLTIARSLAAHTPHRIIGADISSLSPGRFSRSLAKYYRLDSPAGDDAEPYIDSILAVMHAEKVDLWISCSSVVAAVEDGQVVRLAQDAAKKAGRTFEAIQFSEHVVEKFHEKDNFIAYVSSLGLTIPESYRCTSPDDALAVLLRNPDSNNNNKKFLAKPINVDDHARNKMMTLLPLSTPDHTKQYIHALHISPKNPFQLQHFIRGTEYCTHALVIRGHVQAFVSCPSSELLMHYAPLAPHSALSQEMLKFTQTVARHGGTRFTGHLSFDFLVEDQSTSSSVADGRVDAELVLYPIECNPRAHTAVVLLEGGPEMAAAYARVWDEPRGEDKGGAPVYPREESQGCYWVGHDVVAFGVLPVLDALSGRGGLGDVVRDWKTLGRHVLYWRDGTFTVEDPVPFWVLYHVYWPGKFVESLRKGRAWSRVNVSTTKMFEG